MSNLSKRIQLYKVAFCVLCHADDIQPQIAASVDRIRNHSNVAVQYSWRQYATADEEGASAAVNMSNRLSQGSTHLEDDIADISSEAQPAGKTMWPSQAPLPSLHTCTGVLRSS